MDKGTYVRSQSQHGTSTSTGTATRQDPKRPVEEGVNLNVPSTALDPRQTLNSPTRTTIAALLQSNTNNTLQWFQRLQRESHNVLTLLSNRKQRIQQALKRRNAVFNIQTHLERLRKQRKLQEQPQELMASHRHEQHRDSTDTIANEQYSSSTLLRGMVGDVGVALFDPLDLEYLHAELSGDESMVRSSYPMLMPLSSLGLAIPQLVKDAASLVSLNIDIEQETLHSSDEEERYPVDIEPESEADLRGCPRILTDGMIQQIHDEGLRDALKMHKWERCFAIGRDGDSFLTFTESCAPYQQTIVVVKTATGHLLGGFASERWATRGGGSRGRMYYGTGQSFVFGNHPAVEPGLDRDLDPSKELTLYDWSGDNDYCQICNVEDKKIAMGGVGDFGLIVKDDFYRGQTGRCRTFNNPPLTPDPAGQFEIVSLEVYGLVPLFQATSSHIGARLDGSFSRMLSPDE